MSVRVGVGLCARMMICGEVWARARVIVPERHSHIPNNGMGVSIRRLRGCIVYARVYKADCVYFARSRRRSPAKDFDNFDDFDDTPTITVNNINTVR